jgi:putative membrane protein
MWGWGTHGLMRGPLFFGGCLMFLFWIAVIALVVWLVVRLVRSSSNKSAQAAPQAQIAPQPQIPGPDPVLETLRRRLAEGAITAEEFDELRQKLGV